MDLLRLAAVLSRAQGPSAPIRKKRFARRSRPTPVSLELFTDEEINLPSQKDAAVLTPGGPRECSGATSTVPPSPHCTIQQPPTVLEQTPPWTLPSARSTSASERCSTSGERPTAATSLEAALDKADEQRILSHHLTNFAFEMSASHQLNVDRLPSIDV